MINNLDYGLLSEIEKKKLLDQILDMKNSLNSKIDDAISEARNPNLKKIYKQVRDMPDISLEEIENKEWVWNNGHLRGPTEIELYNRRLEQKNYYETTWHHDKNKPTAIMYLFPILWLGVIMSGLGTSNEISVLAFLTFPLSFLIPMILYYFMNNNVIKKAERHGVPYSDEDYKKAKFEKKASSAAIAAGTAGYIFNISSGVKEISNPDSWKKI